MSSKSILLFCVLFLSKYSFSNTIIKVSNIAIEESHYSQKVLSAQIEYDGSLGKSTNFGVIALTKLSKSGRGYRPNVLREGTHQVLIDVSRPSVKTSDNFNSYGLEFTLYNGDFSEKVTIPFQLTWESLEDHFSISSKSNKNAFQSINQLTINEATPHINKIIEGLFNLGISATNIELFYNSLGNSADKFALSAAETTAIEDIHLLYDIVSKAGGSLEKIEIVNTENKKFQLGKASLFLSQQVATNPIADNTLENVLDNSDRDALFRAIGFSGKSKADLEKDLLARAIRLNDSGNKAKAARAAKISNYLISQNTRELRAYAELARAYARIEGMNQSLPKRRSVLQMALAIDPNDQWANAILAHDEAYKGNFESAMVHAKLAIEHEKEQNVWNIINYARIYAWQGKLEQAIEIFEGLIPLDNLNKSNLRAYKIGMGEYLEILRSTNDRRLVGVYRLLIKNDPMSNLCLRFDLAYELMKINGLNKEVRELSSLSQGNGCQYEEQVFAVINLLDLFEQNSNDVSLVNREILRFGDNTALIAYMAMMEQGSRYLQYLDRFNVDLRASNVDGLSALHLLAIQQQGEAVNRLLSKGIDINEKTSNGWTPLMLAVYVQSTKMVEHFLSNGADKSIQAPDGMTALDLALYIDNTEIQTLLTNKQI